MAREHAEENFQFPMKNREYFEIKNVFGMLRVQCCLSRKKNERATREEEGSIGWKRKSFTFQPSEKKKT